MRAGPKLIAVLLLVLSLGLHWSVLQIIAWAGMIVTYSQDSTVREAISKTFDGRNPCPLCKAIERGRQEEQKQEQRSLKPSGKLDPGMLNPPLFLDFYCRFAPPEPRPVHAPTRTEAPPKPRPRLEPA